MHVEHMVHAYEGKRHGTERQHRRIPDGALYPLQPYAQESGLVAEGLAYPAEHTALLVGKHGREFGGHKRYRYQENKCCKYIIECGAYSIFGFRWQSSQRDNRHDVHYYEREHPHFGSLPDCRFCLSG